MSENKCSKCKHDFSCKQPKKCRECKYNFVPSETAFQGMVRKFLFEMFHYGPTLTMPWDVVVDHYPNSIPFVRHTFNATLDLAISEAVAACDGNLRSSQFVLAIEALKELTP